MRLGRFALLAGVVAMLAIAAFAWARARRPPASPAEDIAPAAEKMPDPAAPVARPHAPAAPPAPIARKPVLISGPAGGDAGAAARIEALVRAGEIGQARDAAEDFLRRYPYSGYCQHIETLTGVHPRPAEPAE